MNKLTILLLSGILLMLSACGPSREKSINAIHGLEVRLFSPDAVNFDRAAADSLLHHYEAFFQDFPKDSLCPAYLFKAANLAMNLNRGDKAIIFFDQYRKDFPNGSKAPICLFFKAFILENMLHDLVQARENYLLFIQSYPDNDFADDAQLALQNLGKTPEEMVREFELKRKSDSLANAPQTKGKSKRK